MFDDFTQGKNENRDDEISQPSATAFARKLKIGVGIFFAISIYMWVGNPASSSENRDVSAIKERLTSLELAMQNLQGTAQSSVYSTPVFEAKMPFVPQEIALSEEKSPFTISNDETIHPFPKEIALELSSLFEKEIANNSFTPSHDPVSEKSEQISAKKKSVISSVKPSTSSQAAKKYTVQKGDTLSKISVKFYGTAKKWKPILDANQHLLGQSQVLRSGMVLTIPE
ncbi:MAG: LysM peptidoglycan-binding domain-containing protein [Chlamydia sp.]